METRNAPGRLRRLARRIWMRRALRHVDGHDNYSGLEKIYRLRDPWNLDSPPEHRRFEITNDLIARHFGRVGSILEVGCGEGLQSAYLSRLCTRLEGTDVSSIAISRARQRLPEVNFHVGELSALNWDGARPQFDLVVACEVLYYMSDIRRAINQMNDLGKACFISFFAPEAHKVSPIVDDIPGATRYWASHEGRTWLFAWWVPQRMSETV